MARVGFWWCCERSPIIFVPTCVRACVRARGGNPGSSMCETIFYRVLSMTAMASGARWLISQASVMPSFLG